MKLEINFQKLKDAVTMIEKVAGKHMTLPVLSCILIEVKKNTVIFKSTNLDVGVEVSVQVKSNDEGLITIPAHIISSFVSQIFDQNQVVKMEVISGNLHISASKSRGVIKTMPPEDFPSIPKVIEGEEIILPAEIFIKGLKSVWYSSSVSNVKPELSSVYVYQNDGSLVFVATDSFRLAEKRMKLPITARLSDILIPFKNISDITRLLENMGETINIKINKNLISFEGRGIYIVSRVIDGVFPDYKQIIPKGYVTEAVMLKQDFINALKISNIFSDKFNHIHINIDPKEKIFELQTKNSDIGENKTVVDAALSGDHIEVNFNYKYVADCFQSIDADSVSIQLSGLNRPMVVRPVSSDQSFMYLVMPMNR